LACSFLVAFRFFSYNPEISEGEASFEGVISRETDIRGNNIKVKIGSTLITLPRYPEYKYGDRLRVSGKIQKPEYFDDFNYPGYLKAKGIDSVMYYPKTDLLESGQGSFFYSKMLDFKKALKIIISSSMKLPESSLLSAMILGDKTSVPESFNEKLNKAGVRHVTAISGMHVVIISSVLMSLLSWLGKKRSAVLSIIFIFLFVMLSGFSASAVRACIMGSLFLIAPLFGRQSSGTRSIVLAVLIMLLINPFLVYDAGFQLSFSAALGIIYLSAPLLRILKFIPDRFSVRKILSSTFSAYIFTFPILVYNFGQISLSGPLANIFLLPIVPFIMISGFLLGFYVGATNGMFYGSVFGMIIGIFFGAWNGKCCGIMEIMEGIMAGGGSKGRGKSGLVRQAGEYGKARIKMGVDDTPAPRIGRIGAIGTGTPKIASMPRIVLRNPQIVNRDEQETTRE